MANPLRKTLEFLGLAEESVQVESVSPKTANRPEVGQSSQRANVTPLRKSSKNGAKDVNEILTVHPQQYGDAQEIADNFRDGIPVIINLSQMTEAEARRLVDFSSGLTQGLRGHIERVTPKVFLLSPAHVMVSGDGQDFDYDLDANLSEY